LKAAVHCRSPFIVTWPLELQSPLQPPKTEPPDGVATRRTDVPALKLWVQSEPPAPQLIPGPVTVPLPEPEVDTVRTGLPGESSSNVAWQLRLPVMTTTPSLQSPSPLHPAKTHPDAGSASRETVVPDGKLAEHCPPQSIPPGLLVTLPLPDLPTLSVYDVPPPVTSTSTQNDDASCTPVFVTTLYSALWRPGELGTVMS
jgi:hypothetical protein